MCMCNCVFSILYFHPFTQFNSLLENDFFIGLLYIWCLERDRNAGKYSFLVPFLTLEFIGKNNIKQEVTKKFLFLGVKIEN